MFLALGEKFVRSKQILRLDSKSRLERPRAVVESCTDELSTGIETSASELVRMCVMYISMLVLFSCLQRPRAVVGRKDPIRRPC